MALLKRTEAASRVLNFLWLNLDLPAPPDPDDGSIREPLPAKYVESIRKAARAHPTTEMVLWVDSKRLTERQFAFLKHSVEDRRSNVHLKDLRSIPAYDQEPLYNEPETNPHWRNGGQSSMIWRQVDAAKILISLQGNYEQVFFADLDHAHLDVTSRPVQQMLKKHGLMIGNYSDSETALAIENQLWGFRKNRHEFFETYYATALQTAHGGSNAWNDLVSKVDKEFTQQGIPLSEICLPIAADGPRAEHTGHEWRDGSGQKATPALVDKGELTRVFNAKSKRPGLKADRSIKAKVTKADEGSAAPNPAVNYTPTYAMS